MNSYSNNLCEFETKSKYYTINTIKTETFAETVIRFCELKDITSSRIFAMCTCLDKGIYKRLKSDRDYIPRENTAYAICFGLKLTFAEASYLLQKAKYSLVPIAPDDMYRELLTEMLITGFTYIPNCNKVLECFGFKKLGKTQ